MVKETLCHPPRGAKDDQKKECMRDLKVKNDRVSSAGKAIYLRNDIGVNHIMATPTALTAQS